MRDAYQELLVGVIIKLDIVCDAVEWKSEMCIIISLVVRTNVILCDKQQVATQK